MSEFEEDKDTIEKKTASSLEEEELAEEDEEYVSAMLHTTQGEISKIESDVFGLLQSLVTTLCSIVLLFTFVCPITKVSGSSMEPTLEEDEVMLVWAFFGYEPEISDIVIVTDPTFEDNLAGQSIVKRVIALEGQTVEMDYPNNQVLVDGSPIYEPYLGNVMVDIYGTIDDGVFVVPQIVFLCWETIETTLLTAVTLRLVWCIVIISRGKSSWVCGPLALGVLFNRNFLQNPVLDSVFLWYHREK